MERNIISAKFFADHVQRTHPDVAQGSRDNNDCTDSYERSHIGKYNISF